MGGSEDEFEGEGGGFSGTQGWKLALLFLGLALLSAGFTHANHSAVAHLRRKHQRALRHVLEHLQHELMLLGFISLALTAAEELFLLRICVTNEDAVDGSAHCGEGESPFWSQKTLDQTHIFIFILACTHILYVGFSTVLCSWKLNTWRKWEESDTKDIQPLDPNINPRNSSGLAQLVWRAFRAQFRFSINREIYLSLRRLFLERTGATEDFNFHDFLRESMEEDMSSIIGMNVLMWGLSMVFVMIPWILFLYAGIGCLVVMLAVGTILESVALRLSQAAYERFSIEDHAGENKTDKLTKRRTLRREIDAKNFFWRGNPRLMLLIFQFTLFENAISLAMLCFSLWQDKSWLTVNSHIGIGAAWVLFGVDFLVFLHSALFILPVYAITSTVGSHCATSLQQYAKKMGISPDVALQAYMSRTSSMSQEDVVEAAHYDLRLNADATQETKPAVALEGTPLAKRRGVGAVKEMAQKKLKKVSQAVVSDPFQHRDHSRENEESLTGLLGAILSKQMKEQMALKKAEQEAKDAAREASPGLLQRTMSRTFSKKTLSESSPQPSAADAADEVPVAKAKRNRDKSSPLQSRPSMKDVFGMGTPPPARPGTSGARTIGEMFPEEVKETGANAGAS